MGSDIMELIITFIVANYTWLFPCIISITTIIYLAIKKDWTGIRKEAYKLVCETENAIKEDQAGPKKLQYVLNALYIKFPYLELIPEQLIIKIINKAVAIMKKELK